MDGRSIFRIGDRSPRTITIKYIPERSGYVQADSYSVIGASVQGRLHSYNNIPRDDAFAVRFNGTWLVVAVSDGAGSRKNSRYGASFSVSRLCGKLFQAVYSVRAKTGEQDEVSNRLKEFLLPAFQRTRIDLERFALIKEVGLDELHCTLLGLVLNVKTGEMGVGQIGDGLILGLDDKREARLLAEPRTTDDPGASYFITQDDWEQYLYTQEIPREEVEHFSTFYLMTDGVANDCQYGPPPDILKIWANDMDREIRLVPSLQVTSERLKKYLSNYKAKGSFDDRTLVVIYRNNVGRAT
jgi:hypothetical protein